MEDDITPRLTPPPKPAVLEVSTPKHAVPEVSLVCDSNNSLVWQAPRHNPGTSDTSRQPQSSVKTVRIELSNQEFTRSTARWPLPQPTQEFLRNNPKAAPSQPVAKGGEHTSPLTIPRLPAPQRVIPAEREYKGPQNTASPSYPGHPVHPDKQYNPQVYSPVNQHTPKLTPEAQERPQRDSSVVNQVVSSRQRFPPASTVPHPTGVPQGPLTTHVSPVPSAVRNGRQNPLSTRVTTVPSVLRDVQQDRLVGINGASPPHTFPHGSNIPQDPTGGDGSSASRPHTLTPATSTAHNSTYRPVYPPVITTSTARTTTLPPHTNTDQNVMLPSQSLPHFQQTRPPTHLQDHNHYPGIYGNRDWSSPASSSLPASASSPYIAQGPEYPMGQAWGYPEGHYSPVLPVARLPHSPADPVVYGLIEDQKRQILKLTQDLQKIMERQAKEEEEEERGTPKMTNRQARITRKEDSLHQDASTQTKNTGQPTVQTVGVNTDISWPDLIASLRYHNQNEEEEEETTEPRHLRRQEQGAWLRDIRGGHESVPSRQYLRQPRDSGESASETPDDLRGGSESPSSQEWGQTSPTPPPNTTTATAGPTRVDAGDGWQEVQAGRDRNTPNAPSSPSPPPPTGTTFYHNVLTNIQQILQHTNPAQEEADHHHHHRQQQQQQQQQQYYQQQQQQQPFTPSSQGVVARAGSGEGSTLDPQIEAVRKQLLNFGISFLDPATLAHSNRPLVDSLYLPGLHNAVSLYQSSISTHLHHPSDATAAKYLTDSQLAAIAAASPAMKKKNSGGTDQPSPAPPPSGLLSHHHHRLFFLNGEGENSTSVSMTTRKFLEKYGLQED